MKNYIFMNTPIGYLTLISEKEYLIGIKFGKSEVDGKNISTKILEKTKFELEEYFKGERKTFDTRIKLDGTEFQKACWQELLKIPYGETTCYSEIAKRVKSPKAQRAVGMANNKNKIPIIIPCHRVIGKNKKLVGYAGGIEIKKYLLELEKSNV